jgi:hypothetical protein
MLPSVSRIAEEVTHFLIGRHFSFTLISLARRRGSGGILGFPILMSAIVVTATARILKRISPKYVYETPFSSIFSYKILHKLLEVVVTGWFFVHT